MAHIIKYKESFSIAEEVEPIMSVETAAPVPVIPDDSSEADKQDAIIENKDTTIEDEKTRLIEKIMVLEEQLSNINKENETKINDSIQKGFKSGVEKGREDYNLSVQDKLDHLDGLFNKISDDYKSYLFDSADDLVDVIFASVTKIIANQYSKDILFSIVNESIEDIASSETIKLHVSSDEVDYFDGYEFSNKAIKVTVDSRVQHGGCIIESNKERLDCRLDKKIEIFKNLLMDSKSNVS